MRETLVISYRGQSIPAAIVFEIGGDYNDLYDYDDRLLRDSGGRYYLRQTRELKMPPNARELYSEKVFELRSLDRSDCALEMRRLRAWRLQRTKPRTTIKRITEEDALLWWIHQSSDDEQLRRRLRQAHPHAQRNVFRRRDGRQQSRSFAPENQELKRSPNSNRLC